MANSIKCTCGHSWNKSDSSKKDMYVCHMCGKDNTMKDGGWLNKFEQGGMTLKQKTDNYGKKPNPNEVDVSMGPGYVGLGYNTKGRNYSPAWGGQFAMGGSMPGSVGFTYARVAGSAPSNGKYAKKTKASAQNGKEMKFYQEGLDFKPNSIAQEGAIVDPMGQWAHPGEVTIIPATDITMEGVDYPVLGISDTGDQQMMYPGEDYNFDGEYVTEYPMMQEGGWLNKYQEKAPSDATRVTAPIKPLTKKEQEENARINKETQKRTEERNKQIIADRKSKRETKGDVNVPGSFNITEKLRLFPESVGGVGEIIDEYLNPGTIIGPLADSLGESIAARSPEGVAATLAMTAGAGALGFDPLGSILKVPGKVAKSMESGLLSNAYKLNPYAFKPTEGMMYRGLGKEGMEDALASGVFRAKQDVEPSMVGRFNVAKQFNKAYFSPKFKVADDYGQGYIAEVPRAASDWGKRYARTDWSQIAKKDIPTTEGKILQKDWLRGYKEVPKKENGGWLNKYK